MIHGLLEVDVTKARAFLRDHQATTGEALSFTAFLITCLGKAVDEHKAVHAFRQGSRRLVLFADVDVLAPALGDQEPLVREHAAWAITRIRALSRS